MKLLVRAFKDDDGGRKVVLVKLHTGIDELRDVVIDAIMAGATTVVLEPEGEGKDARSK